jgi:hypothetical protein
MKALLNPWVARLPALLRGLGPYAAIELLLPGGSIIALLIWLCRRRATARRVDMKCPRARTRRGGDRRVDRNPVTLVTPIFGYP